MESVAWKNITVGVCWDLMCRISGMSFFARNFPTPWRDKFAFWPHPCFYAPLYPPLKVWILSCGLTQTGKKWLEIPLLGNFPVSQVACCRYTLLAWNSSISLAGSEEHITFSQQSPNRSDYTQRESNKGKGTEVKQSPPLPFSQGNALGTRLKQGPPSLSLLWREKPVSTLVFKWKTCFHIWIQRFFS